MSISFKNSGYDLILDRNYSIKQFIETATIEDSMDEIASRLSFSFSVPDKMPNLKKLPTVHLVGLPFNQSSKKELWGGLLWTQTANNDGAKEADHEAYDPMKYLAESEDDELLPSGQTASQRFKYYCSKWGIPIGHVDETSVKLSKGVYRSEKIYSMIMSDLNETVAKGGYMYRPYIEKGKAYLVEVGTNKDVWELDGILESTQQKKTLDGAVTKVKIVGESKENALAPILAIESKDTDTYGTLQKVVTNPNSTDLSQARTKAKNMLVGMQESMSVSGADINVIKAGHVVKISGRVLVVRSITHKLGFPGSMSLTLGTFEHVRRDVYGT